MAPPLNGTPHRGDPTALDVFMWLISVLPPERSETMTVPAIAMAFSISDRVEPALNRTFVQRCPNGSAEPRVATRVGLRAPSGAAGANVGSAGLGAGPAQDITTLLDAETDAAWVAGLFTSVARTLSQITSRGLAAVCMRQ